MSLAGPLEPAVTSPARYVVGNMWVIATGIADAWVVVPTNIGWTRHGANVMGRGLAKQAAQRHPGLPGVYGQYLRGCHRAGALGPGAAGALFRYGPGRLLLIPTKPLHPTDPALSWSQPADPVLVADAVARLATALGRTPTAPLVLVPLLGAGNGGLPIARAWDLLRPLRALPCVTFVVTPDADRVLRAATPQPPSPRIE